MSASSLRLQTALLFTLACWIWGSTWLAIKIGLYGVPPFVGAAIRMLLSGALLVGIAILSRTPWPRSRVYALHILVQGCLLFGIQYALIYWAELSVPSGLTAVLFAVTPLLTAFFASAVFRIERISLTGVLGLVSGLGGLVLIYWSEVIKAAHAPPAGVLAVLGGAVCASVSSVFAKRYAHDVPPIATVGPGQLVGGAVLSVLALTVERGQPIVFNSYSLAALGYLTIMGSMVAFLAFFTLMRTMPVTRLALITYITPVVAVLLGFFAAHEILVPTTFLGIAVVFAGIALVHYHPPARPQESTTRAAT